MFSLDVAKCYAYPNSLITERLKRKLVLLELEGSVNVSQLLEFGLASTIHGWFLAESEVPYCDILIPINSGFT